MISPSWEKSTGLGRISLLWDLTQNKKTAQMTEETEEPPLFQKGSQYQPCSLETWRQSMSVWFVMALITCRVIITMWAATWLRHIHTSACLISTTASTVGPQRAWVAAKKGITSPSRGWSQHLSHTQLWTEKKCLSCSSKLLTHFSTSGFKQPQQEAARKNAVKYTSNSREALQHRKIYPLLNETQNYSSPCKVTSSQHAILLGWEQGERKTDSRDDEGG